MPWLNVTFRLISQGEEAFPVPPGTTLRVFEAPYSLSPPIGPPLAEYDLSGALWLNGGSAAVQDGQRLVLHGSIPPGNAYFGPWLEYTATFGRGTMTTSVVLGAQ